MKTKYLKLRRIAKNLSLAAIALFLMTTTIQKLLNSALRNTINEQMINIYNPYKPIFPVSPKAVFSVADQVLSEYIFATHSKESVNDGFQSLFSKIDFDYKANTITITPTRNITTANGYTLSNSEIFDGIVTALKGTTHIPFAKSIIKTQVENNKIVVYFKKIPVNIKYILTLPDFSIQKSGKESVNAERNLDTTGPYYIDSVTDEKVVLKANPNYPIELTANKTETVNLYHYQSDQVENIVNLANPETHHFLYFFGHSMNENLLKILSEKKYKINIHPNEWLVYVGFNHKTPSSTRKYISKIINSVRDNPNNLIKGGKKTFSFAPSDRPYGLTEEEYNNLSDRSPSHKPNSNEKIRVGTLNHWKDIPIFIATRNLILKEFKNAEFVSYDRSEFNKMLNECDVSIRMLGISPADPISPLSFLLDFDSEMKKVTSIEELNDISMISDYNLFIDRVKKIEAKIIDKQTHIPIANFPGIVAIAPQFELNRDLAWSWGIQSWTYHLR